jgi:hypothetical protein
MIKNRLILENFNKSYVKHRQHSYIQRLLIYQELLKEARDLKRIPLQNPLEGLDGCLRIAAILNSLK